MSVIARRFRATPYRSAAETWKLIALLIAPDKTSAAYKELDSVCGIASSLITSEAMKDAAVVCSGSGPRVRIYCLYDEEAILGEEAKEDPLCFVPTEDEDWNVSLPCPTEDLSWVKSALKKRSGHITARDLSERLGPEESKKEEAQSRALPPSQEGQSTEPLRLQDCRHKQAGKARHSGLVVRYTALD